MIKAFLKKIEPKWDAMLEKPFLRSITNGTLSKKVFLFYLVQDTLYLRDYVKCYAFAITKTNDIKVIRILLDCLKLIEKDETAVHIKYLKDYGYTEEKALLESKDKINEEYLNYMFNLSKNGSLSEGLVSLLPCAYSYYYIFKNCKERAMNEKTYSENYYKAYIDYYSSFGYVSGLKKLDILCELVLKGKSNFDKELYKIFETSTEFEAKFWDMPLMQVRS